MSDRDKLGFALESSGIREKFDDWIANLHNGSSYDKAYRDAVVAEMEDGLLKDVTNICNKCSDYLTGTAKTKDGR
jgi:hypothetical protein